jgi:ABC-2 type transport system ATP-binding protein
MAIPDIIRINNVSKRFVVRKDNSLKERIVTLGRSGRRHREEFWALSNVSANVAAGTTIGLIGHNGSGKSTLLKVIGGIIDPTSGSVERRGRVAALLELGAGFHPDLTGRENVFLNAAILGLSHTETEAQLDKILDFAGIGDFIDTQVKFYSSGMYVRLAFAVAVHTDPDLLLVDEVLAVGDEAFQRKCMDTIRRFQQEGRTIILVTHSLGLVAELCDRALLLDRGHIVFDGEPVDAVAAFRENLETRRVEQNAASSSPEPLSTSRVVSVTARAVGAPAGSSIVAGSDLSVSIKLKTDRPLDNWMCAVQIDNSTGQVVYGTTTKRLNLELPVLTGTRDVEFILRDVNFGPGKYFVNVSLMDIAGVHLHDLPQAASFNAPDYKLAVGTLHAIPEFVDHG